MDPDKYNRMILKYLDNELPEAEAVEFESRLAVDSKLREEVRLYQQTWQMLGEHPVVDPKPGFESRFYTCMAGERSRAPAAGFRRQFSLSPWRWAPVVAGLALVLALGVFLFQPEPRFEGQLTGLPEIDLQIMENYELVNNFDLIDDLEFWLDLEMMGLDPA
jgi:anti-sigma factor RsiW